MIDDWIIDRNGEDVRYVIDFYNAKVLHEGRFFLLEVGLIAMHVDVRPALDSLEVLRKSVHANEMVSVGGGCDNIENFDDDDDDIVFRRQGVCV